MGQSLDLRRERPTHQEVAGAGVHVLVHEVQDGEPQSSEGGQRQQRREVLEEHLHKTHRSNMSPLSHRSRPDALAVDQTFESRVQALILVSSIPPTSAGLMFSRSLVRSGNKTCTSTRDIVIEICLQMVT